MFKFLKRKNEESSSQQETPIVENVTEETKEKSGFFARLKNSLKKTRSQLSENLANLILGNKEIDDELLANIEEILIRSDMGIETSQEIIAELTARVKRKELSDNQTLILNLKEVLHDILKKCQKPLVIAESKRPFVILMIGVNGVGKTTTIGKLAKIFQSQGHKIMLAAGDTFRAAAIEQLQVWGERNNIPVISQATGSDSASVVFDALQAAKARNIDILIADTAGRLHTKHNLMEELKKIRRVLMKLDNSAPHEVLLVLDAGNGQNALVQAKQFHDAMQLTGIVLTKLDGTAKGGIIFAIANQLEIPIRFIGVGEGIDDLKPFNADEFIEALFEE